MPLPAMSNPAEGAAGVLNSNHNALPSYNLNLGEWQSLGDVAADVVANLSARRERFIISRCHVSPAVARAVALELFGGRQ